MTSLGIRSVEREALKAFNRGNVQYLLLGGYAMRFYGCPRAVSDVDLLVGRSPENAGRLFHTTEKLLGHAPGFTQAELEAPHWKVSFRRDGYLLDVLTSVDGLDFEVAYKNRKHAREKRLMIPVASISDLIFIKKAAAAADESRRIKEEKDIEFLEAH